MKRIMAWVGILTIAAAFFALVFAAAVGASPNVIMALIFCMMIIPVMIYAFLMVLRIREQKHGETTENNREQQS